MSNVHRNMMEYKAVYFIKQLDSIETHLRFPGWEFQNSGEILARGGEDDGGGRVK